jgi:hypothetical protein
MMPAIYAEAQSFSKDDLPSKHASYLFEPERAVVLHWRILFEAPTPHPR